jgi:hypothetical protein
VACGSLGIGLGLWPVDHALLTKTQVQDQLRAAVALRSLLLLLLLRSAVWQWQQVSNKSGKRQAGGGR